MTAFQPSSSASAADRPDSESAAPLDERIPTPPRLAERADCCSAVAAYRIVLPVRPGLRRPGELLLCGHHTRVQRAALLRAHASIYDADGVLIA